MYPVIVCGLIVGFVASIMGVGGGFLTFPMFVYGLGVSTFTTVGTDILQIIFTTAYSSIFQYAIYGFVFYSVAVGMLLGSLVGVQVGALVTTKVNGSQIRAFFALTILAGFTNRVCALPKKLDDLGYVSLSSTVTGAIEDIGTVVFFGIVGLFAVWIMVVFFRDVVRGRTMGVSRDGTPRRLVAPRRFALGAGLLGVVRRRPRRDGHAAVRRAQPARRGGRALQRAGKHRRLPGHGAGEGRCVDGDGRRPGVAVRFESMTYCGMADLRRGGVAPRVRHPLKGF